VDFLYFPENKAEYIPGFIWFGIGVILAVIAMYLFIRVSNKQAEKAKQQEEDMMKKFNSKKSEEDRVNSSKE
jgi:membrane protein insertase Oxa1/YidC/SpoIIIJ